MDRCVDVLDELIQSNEKFFSEISSRNVELFVTKDFCFFFFDDTQVQLGMLLLGFEDVSYFEKNGFSKGCAEESVGLTERNTRS